ncbi:MAG TPA: SsrA-binding protein SmpB [Candidatus Helicobacter avicola]|nr:SsrA-binding protein SmpB [Candidatus Helicobacter avicola]
MQSRKNNVYKLINKHKKAYFDYEILETLEVGIVLVGSEVKAARALRVNLKDSFVRIIKGEAFLFNAHFSMLTNTNAHFRPDERRVRKLLIHRRQIDKWFGKLTTQALAIVPLSIYFNHKNIIKLEVALARGKKLYDKRESLKQKELKKEAQSSMKNIMRGL